MILQRMRTGGLMLAGLLVRIAVQAQTPVETPAKPFRYDTLAMILALMALIGLVLLWRQIRSAAAPKPPGPAGSSVSRDELGELSGRISQLKEQNRRMAGQLQKLESEVGQLRGEVSARQAFPASTPPPAMPPPATIPVGLADEPVSRPAASQSQRKAIVNALPAKLYARTVDVPGGFSVGSLVETPSRPMVFVIVPTGPGEATFRVTDDAEAQRLALSDPYSYLSDACNYQSRPEANSRIHTALPGRLQLQGDKWHIIEKAEISFYA